MSSSTPIVRQAHGANNSAIATQPAGPDIPNPICITIVHNTWDNSENTPNVSDQFQSSVNMLARTTAHHEHLYMPQKDCCRYFTEMVLN